MGNLRKKRRKKMGKHKYDKHRKRMRHRRKP